MAENLEEKPESSKIKNMLTKLDSPHDIRNRSIESENPKLSELDRIVNNTLDRIISISKCTEFKVNDIIDLVMPSVRCELRSNDKLSADIEYMKNSINSYMQQMQAIDQDIADIYLDLHNIYRKIERFGAGSQKLSGPIKAKLSRRVQESEDLQKRSRHYMTNDAKELSAMLINPPQEPQPSAELSPENSKS